MRVTFGRAIKIGNFSEYDSKRITKTTKETINTMKNDKASIFDKETSAKIGKFLREQIGDYDKQSGIYMKKIYRDVYLYTGEDAKRARSINEEAKTEKQAINREYDIRLTGKSSVHDETCSTIKKLRKIKLEKADLRCDEKLLELVENGYDGKPQTNLYFDVDVNTQKLKEIRYSSHTKDENGKPVHKRTSLTI